MPDWLESMTPKTRPGITVGVLAAAVLLLSAANGASYLYVDLSLNRMGASATAIGVNAAMPALGWLLATPFLPLLVYRRDTRVVLRALTCIAAVTMLGFAATSSQEAWLALRFVFGSSVGIAFRLIEYWISAASPAPRRGRNVGLYAALFCCGAAAGAGILPVVGLEGWLPVLLIAGLIAAATAALWALREGPPVIAARPRHRSIDYTGPLGVAVAAAGIVGLFEAVPYTLMPVYAVRVGTGEDWAAWAASAFLLGQVVFLVPLGMLADRMGRLPVLILGAAVGLAATVLLPETTGRPAAMLAVMVVWGGFVGSLYAVALAMLADRLAGAELAAANASFGTLYAAGALAGPLLHGAAMDWHDPQGLMESSALLFVALLGLALWKAVRRAGIGGRTA